MPGRAYYYGGSDYHPRRKSSKRTSDAGQSKRKDESAAILEASREALKQAQRRPRGSRRSSSYYTVPRVPTPQIPPYSEFLEEARARANNANPPRVRSSTRSSTTARDSFRPDPYLYGYPSGYYTELRNPGGYRDSCRTDNSWRSSTLIGTESQRSSTLVDSNRSSMEASRPIQVRSSRHPRRQPRVHFAPTYTYTEPTVVSDHFLDSPTSSAVRAGSAAMLSSRAMERSLSSIESSSPYPRVERLPGDEELLSGIDLGKVSRHKRKPVNLSPNFFIDHEAYVKRDSAIISKERSERRDHERRNTGRLESLHRDPLCSAAFVSKWSPYSSPEKPRRQSVKRRLSRWSLRM